MFGSTHISNKNQLIFSESGARPPPGETSLIIVLSECQYSFLALRVLINELQAENSSDVTPCPIIWCKNTLEIDLPMLKASQNPIILVTAHPGSETNGLLHKTLALYFTKIIFLTRGMTGVEDDLHFISVLSGCSDVKAQLLKVMSNDCQRDVLTLSPADDIRLSEREQAFTRLVCQGLDAKSIASRMEISLPTVYSYRRNISRKVGTRNIEEMILRFNTLHFAGKQSSACPVIEEFS